MLKTEGEKINSHSLCVIHINNKKREMDIQVYKDGVLAFAPFSNVISVFTLLPLKQHFSPSKSRAIS